jgi:hypothetical protein
MVTCTGISLRALARVGACSSFNSLGVDAAFRKVTCKRGSEQLTCEDVGWTALSGRSLHAGIQLMYWCVSDACMLKTFRPMSSRWLTGIMLVEG